MIPTTTTPRDPDLTAEQIRGLIGRRDAATGIAYPPAGLQPYHDWLIRTLHRLAAASLGAFAVRPAAADTASVAVAAGRATIDGQVIDWPDTVADLSLHNNATCLLALVHTGGAGQLVVSAVAAGWPAGPHLKLAEVTLADGVVIDILDRRLETLFRV